MQQENEIMKLFLYCIIIIACLDSTGAWAGEPTVNNVLHNQINIFAGAQFYQAEGKFSSSKDGRPTASVDLEDLGLDDNLVTPVFGAHFNFGKKWTMRLDYFGYHDDARSTAKFNFDFDGYLFPVGVELDSSLDLDVYVIT